MSAPFDVDGLWQIRLTITSPNRPSFRTQGYVDESTKDKILATLSEKTQQSSDKLSEATDEHIELLEFVKLAIAQEREACARLCEARYMGDNNREDMEARRCASAIRARSND